MSSHRQITMHYAPSMMAHFDIEKASFLGSGGYGAVSLVKSHNERFNDIAVKKFHDPFATTSRATRCYRELLLLSRLSHPHIVRMTLAYTPQQTADEIADVYLVTEYAGSDLRSLIYKETLSNHVFLLDDYKRMLAQLLQALLYLHSAKIIHRDLKPDNLAVNRDGALILLDFGLARVVEQQQAVALTRRAIAAAVDPLTKGVGTELYRAIETLHIFSGRYDERADIWSLGAILCEMLTGSIIFDDDTAHALYKAVEICGPIKDTIINQITDPYVRAEFRHRSRKSRRINFYDFFKKYARSWLKADIKRDKATLLAFIDKTLQFDQADRMGVEQALSHPFLSTAASSSNPLNCFHPFKAARQPLDKLEEALLSNDETAMDLRMRSAISNESIGAWKARVWQLISETSDPYA